jgi:hypothetical protein
LDPGTVNALQDTAAKARKLASLDINAMTIYSDQSNESSQVDASKKKIMKNHHHHHEASEKFIL